MTCSLVSKPNRRTIWVLSGDIPKQKFKLDPHIAKAGNQCGIKKR